MNAQTTRGGIVTAHEWVSKTPYQFAWLATRDGHDAGDPIGHGPTEQAAIDDLLAQEEAKS